MARAVVSKTSDWEDYNGRVAALESVSIRPRVSGYIKSVAYQEGAEVKKGDLLFEIDPRPYQAALESANAERDRAKANVEYTKEHAQRTEKLLPFRAISQKDADEARRSYRQSMAELASTQAQLKVAELNLEFTKIRSPINGRTSRAQQTVGNLAVSDQSVLTTVVSQSPVYVYFDPDEKSYLRHKSSGGEDRDFIAAVGLASDSTYPYLGKIDFVDNEVNSSTGTIRARIKLNNAKRLFTPGLYAKVKLAVSEEKETVLINEQSIITDQDKKFVYVVNGESIAERRDIQVGKSHDGLRVVVSGLSGGEVVVTSGHQHILTSGDVVIPKYVNTEKSAALQTSSLGSGWR
ncbi:hypothetical protein AWM69_12800 [Pseudomonas sp. D1HM]|nr:hypothetical protein [Pseudomonas sp. D1HM]